MLGELRPHLRHLSGKGRALAALFVLGLLASAASLAGPLIGKSFIDAVSARRDFGAVPGIAAALLGLAFADLLLGTVSRWVHARLSADILADLRARLFRACLTSPLDSIERLRHGDLLTRFGTDVPRIQILLVDGVLGAAQNVLFLTVAAAVLIGLSRPLALWSFTGLALALVAVSGFRRAVGARAVAVRRAMADVSHFLSERLAALRPIRFHRAEAEEEVRLCVASDSLSRAVVSYQLLDSAVSGGPGLLLTLSLAWIYLLGGRLLQSGEIGLGTFVAFVLYQGKLFSPAQGILALVRNLQEAAVSLDRVAEVLTHEGIEAGAATVHPEVDGGGGIVLRDVAFSYPGKPPVFRGVNLRVSPGERIALFGASGAGKSTLVQLLFGLRSPGAGTVRIDGLPPSAYGSNGLRHRLGYAGAEPFLLHGTVEENVLYGNPPADSEALSRALRLAEAEGFVEGLPQGRRTVIGGKGLALSDGQRQRLGLARLFLRSPAVLVLDEAFSALDLDTEARIRENLWSAFPDRTLISISHRPVGLEDFDRVLLLRDGEITPVDPQSLGVLLPPADGRNPAIPKGETHVEAPPN